MEIVCDLLRTKGEHYAVFLFDMLLKHEYKLIPFFTYLFSRMVAKKFLATANGRQHIFFGVRNVPNWSSSLNYGTDLALKINKMNENIYTYSREMAFLLCIYLVYCLFAAWRSDCYVSCDFVAVQSSQQLKFFWIHVWSLC